MKKNSLFLGIIILIIDQLSKILVINKNITIIPNFFYITYIKNFHAAFGIGNKYFVLLTSILIILLIIILLIKNRKNISNFIPFVLILSGSIGNLIDRIFKGYVIDFLNFNIFNFPIFNIADISIVLGFCYLIFIIISKKY